MGPLQRHLGVQLASPPEADEFLHGKGSFIKTMENERIEKICKKFSKREGGGRTPGAPALDPPMHTLRSGPLSREGSLPGHTCCDTGSRFFRSHLAASYNTRGDVENLF